MLNTVNLEAVRLQRASLGKRFLAQIALVWANAGVCSGVSFQIERIVESFSAECAQVSLYIRVTLHVTIQQSLESEML